MPRAAAIAPMARRRRSVRGKQPDVRAETRSSDGSGIGPRGREDARPPTARVSGYRGTVRSSIGTDAFFVRVSSRLRSSWKRNSVEPSRAGRGVLVPDHRGRHVVDLPPGQSKAPGQVGVLVVHEEVGVDAAHLLHGVGAQQRGRAGEPEDRAGRIAPLCRPPTSRGPGRSRPPGPRCRWSSARRSCRAGWVAAGAVRRGQHRRRRWPVDGPGSKRSARRTLAATAASRSPRGAGHRGEQVLEGVGRELGVVVQRARRTASSPRPRASATPPANPRLRSLDEHVDLGVVAAEALLRCHPSIRCPRPPSCTRSAPIVCRRIESRQAGRRCKPFQVTTTTVTTGGSYGTRGP